MVGDVISAASGVTEVTRLWRGIRGFRERCWVAYLTLQAPARRKAGEWGDLEI